MKISKKLNLLTSYKLFIILGFIISIASIYFKNYQTVFYESELEQIYSYLFIDKYQRPYLTNHPGGPIYFIVYFILSLFKIEQHELVYGIYVLRITYFIIPLFLLWFANQLNKKFLNKDMILKILLFYLLFPLINIWFYNAFFYLIVFSLGYLTLVLIEIYLLKKIFFKTILFFLGFTLSIYIGSITLVAYFVMRRIIRQENFLEKIKIIVSNVLIVFLIYLILNFPIFPDSLEPIQIVISKIIFVCEYYFLFFIISIIGLISFIVFSRKFQINDNNFNLIFFVSVLSLPFLFKLLPFLLKYDFVHPRYFYFDSLISFRLILPILSIVLFFNLDFLTNKFKVLIISLFFLISTINMYYFINYKSNKLDNLIENNFVEFNNKHLYFLQTPKFSSEYRFLAWGSYRYGNLLISTPNEWKINKVKNFSLINLREHVDKKSEIIIHQAIPEQFLFKDQLINFFSFLNKIIDKIQYIYNLNKPKVFQDNIGKPIDLCTDKYFSKNLNNSVVFYEPDYDNKDQLAKLLKLLKNCKKIEKISTSKKNGITVIEF